MRLFVAIACATACTSTTSPSPTTPLPIDTVWAAAIHPGDLFVLVPGTGSHDHLGAAIDALPGDVPVVDVRAVPDVALYSDVLEQAIAAAHRAGIADADLESGALPIAMWGVGFARVTAFTYVGYDGLHVPIEVLGGQSTCAVGNVLANLVNYSTANAQTDSADLDARIRAWLAAHPATHDVLVSAHSWGGAVAEWLAYHGGTARFTIAAGVPGLIPGYQFAGPGLRYLDGPARALYEIDRPDDPVHAMNPSGNGHGHHYVILYSDSFQGQYGVTTDEISCNTIPGPCAPPR